jgi:hypothetical protein
MTPPEVVDLMVGMAISDLEKEPGGPDPLVVLDPTCGVGSFLTAFYHRAQTSPKFSKRPLRLIGQDKVERMVRLARINLLLFDAVDGQITLGNSLSGRSPLSELNRSVDLILTNPPFGAKFSQEEILQFGRENLPVFTSLPGEIRNVDSELLFIDRDLTLLKEGGRLLVVVPDSAVSATGLPSILRQCLKTGATVKAVIELPQVTFAQAGTRAKTCILYLVKGVQPDPQKSVFLAKSEAVGFDVSYRRGVQVKVTKGSNDLPLILKAYRSDFDPEAGGRANRLTRELSESPSCVRLSYDEYIDHTWTPNRYSADRFQALGRLGSSPEIQAVPLSGLVEFQNEKRTNERFDEGSLFVSVLHIAGEGMLDIHGVRSYRPKTPGIRVEPGEIIFSRINPRIPRVFVMPKLGEKMLCSSEFAILAAKNGTDPFLIAYLLRTGSVQRQILSLTSGTSSSHSRIKTQD